MTLFAVETKFFSKFLSAFYLTPIFLYLLALLSNVVYVTGEQCLATAFAGTFRGVFSQSQSVVTPGFPYCSYRGIRFGQPPIGDLRFARPVLAAPLGGGVYNASTDGNQCPQLNLMTGLPDGNEDCLFLNVYTPQTQDRRSQSLLPVMVFIHGGAFVIGSSDSQIFGPDHLVPKNVVLVTMNYRLNSFGFLNLKLQQCSGNMGLADQILAYRWVQQNIRAFGGDPNKVTLFGESAGGQSTYLLSLSPQAQGLFQKVIIESTVLTTESYLVRDPNQVVNSSIRLAGAVGYLGDQNDHGAVLRYLLKVPVAKLVEADARLFFSSLQTDFDGFYHSRVAPLAPCTDNYTRDSIIPSSFEVMGRAVPPIPIMIGQLDADGSVYLGFVPDLVNYTKNNLRVYLQEANPSFVKDQQTEDRITAAVKARYYSSGRYNNDVDATVKLLTFLSYYNFYKQISYLRASYSSGNIRVFQFRFANGPYDVAFKNGSNLIRGAIHGEEVIYIFYPRILLGSVTPSSDERRLVNEMSTWWTNFAKYGNPNSVCDGIEVEWEPSTSCLNRYLEINTTTRLVNTKINQEEYDFFAQLEASAKNNQGGRSRNARPLCMNASRKGFIWPGGAWGFLV